MNASGPILERPLVGLEILADIIMPNGKVADLEGPIAAEIMMGDRVRETLRLLGYQKDELDEAASALLRSVPVLRELAQVVQSQGLELTHERGAELGWKWVAVGAPMLTIGYRAGGMEADVPLGKACMLRTRILFAAPELGVFTTLYFKPDGGGQPLYPLVISLEYSGVWDAWCVVMDDLVHEHGPFLRIVPDAHARRGLTREKARELVLAMAQTLRGSLG